MQTCARKTEWKRFEVDIGMLFNSPFTMLLGRLVSTYVAIFSLSKCGECFKLPAILFFYSFLCCWSAEHPGFSFCLKLVLYLFYIAIHACSTHSLFVEAKNFRLCLLAHPAFTRRPSIEIKAFQISLLLCHNLCSRLLMKCCCYKG